MQADHCLTPSLMLAQFADGRIDTCRRAISELRKLEPEQRQAFLKPTISFMSTEKEDGVRTTPLVLRTKWKLRSRAQALGSPMVRA